MIDVSDLIGIPYKQNGRDKNGFDCYGLAIEVEKRFGTPLVDIFQETGSLPNEKEKTLNVEKTDFIQEGCVLEMYIKGELHIGVALSPEIFIHCTYNQGVRLSYCKYYKIENVYKVV